MLILLKLFAILLALLGIYIIYRSDELEAKRHGQVSDGDNEDFLTSLGLPSHQLRNGLHGMRTRLIDYLFVEEAPETVGKKKVKSTPSKTSADDTATTRRDEFRILSTEQPQSAQNSDEGSTSKAATPISPSKDPSILGETPSEAAAKIPAPSASTATETSETLQPWTRAIEGLKADLKEFKTSMALLLDTSRAIYRQRIGNKISQQESTRQKPTSLGELRQRLPSPISWAKGIGTTLKRIDSILIPNTNARRNQQMLEISSGFEDSNDDEKALNKALRTTTYGLAWVGASLLFAPLMVIAVGTMVYGLIPIFKEAYDDVFTHKKLRSSLLSAGFLVGILWSGFYTVGMICLWISLFTNRLLLGIEDKTKSGMISLFVEQPNTVMQYQGDGHEVEVSIDAINPGDTLVVGSGQMIPVDGRVLRGTASVDQHRLTGESAPVEKGEGDEVYASTLVLSGRIYLQVEHSGEDTVAMKVVHALESTADFKSGLQSKGEAFADSFVLPMALGSLALWPFMGFHAAVAILASTPGYNMKLFGPVSLLSSLTLAAEEGILIKDGRAIECIEDVDTIVFDKTGTLTVEQPTVDIITTDGSFSSDEILRFAATAEQEQSHPIAHAIMAAAQSRALAPSAVIGSRVALGFGLEIDIEEGKLLVGSHRFMQNEGVIVSPPLEEAHQAGQLLGQTVIFVALNGQAIGTISLRSTLRDGVIEAVQALQARGLELYILSGDAEAPTRHLAQEVGITHYFAETLPEDKANVIASLTAEGKKVCFMGDGINDSIAMKQAHVAVSLRGATTLATDTAQIILMESHLGQLNALFALVERHSRTMKRNFVISTVPSMLSATTILFFGGGIISGYFFITSGLLAGITNSLSPALRHQKQKRSTPPNSAVIDVDFTALDEGNNELAPGQEEESHNAKRKEEEAQKATSRDIELRAS